MSNPLNETDATPQCDCADVGNLQGVKSKADQNICSLPPAEEQDRRAMYRRNLLVHVKRIDVLPDGRAWEFDYSEEMGLKLNDLMVFERQCCNGLNWDLEHDRRTDRIRLSVTGIDPHSEFLM